jgi:mRNA interferase RelE/StbE
LAWRIEYDADALEALKKLGRSVRSRIDKYLSNVAASQEPRARGKALGGNLAGLWRYRVGDWRVLCDIQDEVLVILAVEVGHRSTVYDA